MQQLAAQLREQQADAAIAANLKELGYDGKEECPTGLVGQQPVDQLPWFHIVTLLTKVSADTEREWYAAQVIQHGWSRPTSRVDSMSGAE